MVGWSAMGLEAHNENNKMEIQFGEWSGEKNGLAEARPRPARCRFQLPASLSALEEDR